MGGLCDVPMLEIERWLAAAEASDYQGPLPPGMPSVAFVAALVRSVNTSVVALLPVAGLLFIGSGLLGGGMLKDISLSLFIGLTAGTYSSLLIATPVLVDLSLRRPEIAAHTRKVLARRARRRDTVADDGGGEDEEEPVAAAVGGQRAGDGGRTSNSGRGRR